MTSDSERLRAAALRHEAERAANWHARYVELGRAGRDRAGYFYTPEALAIFPRYQVLAAIRVALERFEPASLPALAEARELFATAALSASSDFTQFTGPRERAAALEERMEFARFVREVSAADIGAVESGPYRRVLTDVEARRAWHSVAAEWDIEPRRYWYPLRETSRADVQAFQAPYFRRDVRAERLSTILVERGIDRLWELREYGPEYELEPAALDAYYNGAEGTWSSSACDWLLYASHESSISVGGWLLDEVKRIWPEWERYVWTTPFF